MHSYIGSAEPTVGGSVKWLIIVYEVMVARCDDARPSGSDYIDGK